MSPASPRLRVAVVGNGRVEDVLLRWDGDVVLDVESVSPAAVSDGLDWNRIDPRRTDCVIVDGRSADLDPVDAAERVDRWDADVSTVVLTDGWDGDRVAEVVSSGVAGALPRVLLDEDPAALVERIAAAADDGASPEAPSQDADSAGPNRRERLVRRLHDPTEAIQHAETEQGVCAATIDAAASVLDLQAPTCWLAPGDRSLPVGKDQSLPVGEDQPLPAGETQATPVARNHSTQTPEERLTPVAGNEAVWRLPGSDEEPVRFGPGDPAYDAYDDGDVTVVEAARGPAPDGAEGAVFLPLGSHGVLGAGTAAADGPDDVTRDVASTLARHAATALDRVARRRELRRSERRLRLISERIDEIIFLAEPDFSEVFYVNDAYEEVWNEPVETVYEDPRSFIDAIDPQDRDSFEAEFESMLDDVDRGDADDRYVFEFRVRPDPDEVRWVRATGYPVESDSGDTRFVGIAEDVTERRELEATYRGVFENVSDGLVIHHPETGEIVDANDRFCEMNGYDCETLVGETIDVVTAKDYSYERAAERIEAAREEGPQLFEWRNRTAEGETFPVEVHLSVVEIRGEERVLGSVRDISDRRRTERRLSEVLDRIDEAVYIAPVADLTRADGDPDYLSSGYEEIWGRPLETIREQYENGFFDTIHPDDRDDYRAFVEGIVDDVAGEAAAGSYDIEYRIERPDGEFRWVRSEYYPIEWRSGPPRVVIVSRDVTERKRTRRNLRTIAERVDEAIYMSSPDKREVYYASPSFEDLWDLPIERIYDDPQAFIERVHPDDREWFREEYDRIRADLTRPDREPQDTYELEYRVRHPDGEVRWISVRGYPVFDDAGGVDRWIAVNRDVTDRKARERRIASFDEATEDLTTADSAAEAAATAVEAARDILDLPAVGAFLYDDDAGVLRPEALAGALSDAGPEPIEPDEGRLWEAFATGTVVAPPDQGDRSAAGTPDGDGGSVPLSSLAAWRAIPLGTHGVLVVGAPEGSFESGTVQTAHVLAATLEAALAHLRGQQRLADSGPYDLAWLGGAEVGSDRLTPRAVSGPSEEYVDAMRLRPDTDGDRDRSAGMRPLSAGWRRPVIWAGRQSSGCGSDSAGRGSAFDATSSLPTTTTSGLPSGA